MANERILGQGGGRAGPVAGLGAERDAWRVTVVGLAVNVLLSIFKLVAGVVGASRAMVADAVHSISDLSTDVAVLVGMHYWNRPADQCHPYGHRRIETLVTVVIGLVLGVVAIGIVRDALMTIREPHLRPPGGLALVAALVSIAGKEALYQWTARVGRRVGSPALMANAWHHRSDSLSSIASAVAVAGARLVPGLPFLDHIGACVVGLFILHAAWKILWPALRELADRGVSARESDRIASVAAQTPGVEQVHKIRTRYIGTRVLVDLHVLVNPEMTVSRGHDIAEDVKARLLQGLPRLVDVVVHLEPVVTPAGRTPG